MKKAIVILLALSLLLAGCGTAKSTEPEEVKYYQTERILTFSYGSTVRDTYEYDKNWNLILGTTYHDGEETSRIHYNNTENSTKMTILQDGEEFTTEFRLIHDAHGNQTRVERYNDGELTVITECTFDEQGNRLTQTDTRVATNDTSKLEMEYDENGNMTKMTLDGLITTLYTYDDEGRILTQEQLPAEGQNSYFREYSYSSDGLRESVLLYTDSSKFTYAGRNVTTYDEAGNMLVQKCYDGGGQLMSTTACSYIGTDGSISSGIESEE